jgi:hypothetical protein
MFPGHFYAAATISDNFKTLRQSISRHMNAADTKYCLVCADQCRIYITNRLDIEEQHFTVEGRNVGQICVKSPVNTEVCNNQSPNGTRCEDFQPRHFSELQCNIQASVKIYVIK